MILRTIDQEIQYHRESAERAKTLIDSDEFVQKSYDAHFNKLKYEKCAEEHGQIAEWLEELKAFRENKWTDIYIRKGYDNALRDLIHQVDSISYVPVCVDCMTKKHIIEIAEHIKSCNNDDCKDSMNKQGHLEDFQRKASLISKEHKVGQLFAECFLCNHGDSYPCIRCTDRHMCDKMKDSDSANKEEQVC